MGKLLDTQKEERERKPCEGIERWEENPMSWFPRNQGVADCISSV